MCEAFRRRNICDHTAAIVHTLLGHCMHCSNDCLRPAYHMYYQIYIIPTNYDNWCYSYGWPNFLLLPFESNKTAHSETHYITCLVTVDETSATSFSLWFELSRKTRTKHSEGGNFVPTAAIVHALLWKCMHCSNNCLHNLWLIQFFYTALLKVLKQIIMRFNT